MDAILVFFCLIANWPFWPRSRLNIPSNFTFDSEAKRANLQENKRILQWRPFWNKVYIWQPRSQGFSSLPPNVSSTTLGGREEKPWERGRTFGLKGPRTYLARVSKEVKFHFRSMASSF